MPVLVIGFRHAAVVCSILRIFLHVMGGGIGDYPGRGHRVTNMLGEGHFTALDLPCASVIPGQQKLLGIVTLG